MSIKGIKIILSLIDVFVLLVLTAVAILIARLLPVSCVNAFDRLTELYTLHAARATLHIPCVRCITHHSLTLDSDQIQSSAHSAMESILCARLLLRLRHAFGRPMETMTAVTTFYAYADPSESTTYAGQHSLEMPSFSVSDNFRIVNFIVI